LVIYSPRPAGNLANAGAAGNLANNGAARKVARLPARGAAGIRRQGDARSVAARLAPLGAAL
jgi:hypothetical protein